jgi:hypothetical protein
LCAIENKTQENHRNNRKNPEMPLTKLFRQWMVDFGTVLKTRVNTGDFVLESGWVPAVA